MYLLPFLSLALIVVAQQLDFHPTQNQNSQHTSSYRVSSDILVLRRATTFLLSYSGSPAPSGFRLQAVNPFTHTPESGNIVRIPIQKEPNVGVWQALTSNNINFTINAPATASVSMYSFAIEFSDKVVPSNQLLVFCFNPWSNTDPTYLADAASQKEYLLNEQGAMWLSPGRGSGWTWDHFDQNVFEVTLWFVQLLPFNSRSNLNIVSRHLTATMNANNGKGLMYGRWREPYSDGKEPWKWVGSGEIFAQYRKTQTPVRYAQCWVFAGVLVSAGRTLGIPARQITNFNSAHEEGDLGPYRLTIDYLSPSDGSDDIMIGSIWNFHAWTEFWFSRSDISSSGWQVVDATPQEISDNKYQMGPASQLSVRSQKFNDQWDTKFVASETNAAIRQYVQFKTGKPEHPFRKGYYLASEQLNACGRDITTKAIGSDNPETITSQYKFKSSSVLRHKPLLQTPRTDDDEVHFTVNQSQFVVMGDDLFLELTAECPLCSSSLVRQLDIRCKLTILSYNGQTLATFSPANMSNYILDDSTFWKFEFPLSRQEYQPYLLDADFLQSSIVVRVTDLEGNTTQYFSQLKRYEIEAPALDLFIRNISSSSFRVIVFAENPLSVPLTNATLTISGAHVQNQELSLPALPGNFSRSAIGPIVVNLPDGWTNKGWITAYFKITSDEIARMDVLAVIFDSGKILLN